MVQPTGNQGNCSEHNLSPAERQIIKDIRDRIHQNIGHVSPAIAYELSQVLGLVAQVARTKDIDDQKPGVLRSIGRSLFGKSDIAVPREELLEILETTSIILTEGLNESKAAQKQRLIFAREIMHKIDIQSRHFPNPMTSLFARYTSLEDRLLSGVVWFFTLFFITPSALALFILTSYVNETSNADREAFMLGIKDVIEVQESMSTSLNSIQAQMNQIAILGTGSGSSQSSNQSPDSPSQDISSVDAISVPISILNSIQESVQDGLQEKEDNVTKAMEYLQRLIEDNSEGQVDPADAKAFFEILGIQWNALPLTGILVFLISVSMGALGGSVSVITTSDKFINITKAKKVDPFYIGFFRPFVGMAFAIFVVALIESGIFSNILNLGDSGERNGELYLFAAIAFIAGFSERFAPGLADQVSRTPVLEKGADDKSEDEQV